MAPESGSLILTCEEVLKVMDMNLALEMAAMPAPQAVAAMAVSNA